MFYWLPHVRRPTNTTHKISSRFALLGTTIANTRNYIFRYALPQDHWDTGTCANDGKVGYEKHNFCLSELEDSCVVRSMRMTSARTYTWSWFSFFIYFNQWENLEKKTADPSQQSHNKSLSFATSSTKKSRDLNAKYKIRNSRAKYRVDQSIQLNRY